MSQLKDKKEDDINLNMFINSKIINFPSINYFQVLEDNERKIDRPISAPPPGLMSMENVIFLFKINFLLLIKKKKNHHSSNEGFDLTDYNYYLYYYSQKPLDPRLPKPLIHWDKNMT